MLSEGAVSAAAVGATVIATSEVLKQNWGGLVITGALLGLAKWGAGEIAAKKEDGLLSSLEKTKKKKK